MNYQPTVGVGLSFLALCLMIWAGLIFFSRPVDLFAAGRDQTQIHIRNTTLPVWTAISQDQWMQGLSGTDQKTLGAEGMLFLFPDQSLRHFWMKDMRYDLDVLWIADGKIVKITEGANAPISKWGAIDRMSSEPFAVSWVLEVPKGVVLREGWQVGDTVGLTPLY